MVRQRSLVTALLVLGLASSATADDSSPRGKDEPIERRPYAIRVWIAADPTARLDPRMRDELISAWKTLVHRFVGAAWQIELVDGDGPLASAAIDDLTAEQVASAAKGADKAWAIAIGPADSGFALSGREYDSATTWLGPTRRREAPFPVDVARSLFHLSRDVFSPTAEVSQSSKREATITVQGAAIPSPDPIGRLAAEGTVFRPFRILYLPNGSIRKDLIRSTYLRAHSVEGPTAKCEIYTSYEYPLTTQVVQKNRIVAVGVKPARAPSRLRFVVAGQDRAPAAGYTLTARTVPDGTPRQVGATDREGRITLPADLADGLVILRLLAADVEPLAEFPLMPGELTGEKTYVLRDTMSEAVAFETKVKALGDEVIDQVARRSRLEGLLKFRAEAEVWGDVHTLLDEYRKLPSRESFEQRLKQLEDDARRRQSRKIPILTKTAQAVLSEAQGLVAYLDDDAFKAYEEALPQAQGGSKEKAAAKAAPGPYGRAAATAANDESKIQGTWRALAHETEGKDQAVPGDEASRRTLTLRDGSFTFDDRNGQVFRGKYRIDPSRSPRTIDFLFEGQAKHSFGIYDLAGGRVTICSAPPGAPRPTIFETRANSGQTLYKYERLAPESTPDTPEVPPDRSAPAPASLNPEPARPARPAPKAPPGPSNVQPF